MIMPNLLEQPSAASLNVLVVDDHVDTQRAMQRLLGSLGYHVLAAASVDEAMRLAEAHSFDLLISDLVLPDGSGTDLMQHVNGLRPTKGIVVTARNEASDLDDCRAAGFSAHLLKPTDLPRLLATIQSVVEHGMGSLNR